MKYILLFIFCLSSFFVYAQRPSYQSVTLSDYLHLRGRRITDINITWGADSLSHSKIATMGAINEEINRRLLLLFNYINEVQVIETNGSFFSLDGLLMVNTRYVNVNTLNYTIDLDYPNIEYNFSGGGGTFTLPVISVTNDTRVFWVYNKTSGAITFNNTVWIDNTNTTTTLAAGKWGKFYIDNTAGRIRLLGGN